MLQRLIGSACFLILVAPLTLHAQQDTAQAQDTARAQQQEPPPTLVVSQWQCDTQEIGNIVESMEQVLIPVWEDMRQEGLLQGAGIFVHEWGDEWNVGMYRIAPDKETFFRAYEEEGQRVQDQLGELNIAADTPGPLQEHCTAHRDNIYLLGPTVGGGETQ